MISISEEWELSRSFSVPFQIEQDSSVLNLSFLVAVLITLVFCGAFYFNSLRTAEIGFLNLCMVNKICPNQISLSLRFKIHTWGVCVYVCLQRR